MHYFEPHSVDEAAISEHFKAPPYRAELFSESNGTAGVMNANGINVLTFPKSRGSVLSSLEWCQKIAEHWNG